MKKNTFAIFNAVILSSCMAIQAADLATEIESAAKTSYHFSPPADAGIINVKDHGAKGDGMTDDTAAVLAAVAHSARHQHFRDMVFFPKGTYLLSDRISTGEGRFFAMMGEERDTTVIRLKDGTAGFGDPENPKPFFEIGGGPRNNQAFGNYVQNLTISTGSGNPGACALRYKASNYGATTELTLRSEDGRGIAGLDLNWGDPGPEAHRNMHIIGFDYGIRSTHAKFGPVLENILLEKQNVAGVHNRNNCLWIRRVLSRNTVPALINAATVSDDKRPDPSMVLLVDSVLTGGDANAAAIVEESGMLLLENISASGYGSLLKRADGSTLPGPALAYYATLPPLHLGPLPERPLALPVQEHPQLPYEPGDKWVSVRDFASPEMLNEAKEGDADWSDAIQKAIDSGATTVYFPKTKRYRVDKTIHIRGKVSRLIGMRSVIEVNNPTLGDNPVFRFDGDQPQVIVEHLHTWQAGENRKTKYTAWEHAAKGTFVLQYSNSDGYRNLPGAGPVFVLDHCGAIWELNKQQAWLRSINVEAIHAPTPQEGSQIEIDGGRTWILGYKTEGGYTAMDAKNQAEVRLLGGFHYAAQGFSRGLVPLYILKDSKAAITFSTIAHGRDRGDRMHKTLVTEQRGGSTKKLELSEVAKAYRDMKFGRVINVPMFVAD